MPVGVKVGPRHHDVLARPDHFRGGKDVPGLDPGIAQQPVDLRDGVLGEKRLSQRLANHRDSQKRARHHPKRRIGKKINPLRMGIFRKNTVEKAPDILELHACAFRSVDHIAQ